MIIGISLSIAWLCEAKWELQNSGVTYTLRSVWFTDSLNGWIVGDLGMVLHTTDGGNTWEQSHLPTYTSLEEVSFLGDSIGLIVGGGVWRTINGGESWEQIQEYSSSRGFFGGAILKPDCYVCVGGGINEQAAFYALFIKTTDGGAHWDEHQEISSNLMLGVDFADSLYGWAVGGPISIVPVTVPKIYHTVNGGDSWHSVSLSGQCPLWGVDFVNRYVGWAVGDPGPGESNIIHTTNGGASWSAQTAGIGNDRLMDVSFINEKCGWIVGFGPVIYSTVDGGSHWEVESVPAEAGSLFAVYFIDTNHGWAVGTRGTILKYSQEPGVDENVKGSIAQDLSLKNYPNPFNQFTVISYQLPARPPEEGAGGPAKSKVLLKIYDISGRLVKTLLDEVKSPGCYFINWNANGIANGIYFCRLQIGEENVIKQMLLLR